MVRSNRNAAVFTLAFGFFLSSSRDGLAQQGPPAVNVLPSPTGSFPIGRVTYHWIDSTQPDPLSRDTTAPREIIVDVWYPRDPGDGPHAPYLPQLPALRRALPDSVIARRYAPAFSAARRLLTHAVEGARTRCPQGGCPLLLFSHGGGVDRSLYTAQYSSRVTIERFHG